MAQGKFDNRVTRLLGVEIPVVEGSFPVSFHSDHAPFPVSFPGSSCFQSRSFTVSFPGGPCFVSRYPNETHGANYPSFNSVKLPGAWHRPRRDATQYARRLRLLRWSEFRRARLGTETVS